MTRQQFLKFINSGRAYRFILSPPSRIFYDFRFHVL